MKPLRRFLPGEDDLKWAVLGKTHVRNLESLDAIHPLWLQGYTALGIDPSRRPLEQELSAILTRLTGFKLIQTGASVILPQIEWYGHIADYRLPCTCFVRTPEELNYCDEPDYWHDVMGHVTFLALPAYVEMYTLLAKTYIKAFRTQRTELLSQLDFIGGLFIELGLIRNRGAIKAFGATFYSSGEVFEAFKPENQVAFSPDSLLSGEIYNRHRFQGKYYVFESMEQVLEIINSIAAALA